MPSEYGIDSMCSAGGCLPGLAEIIGMGYNIIFGTEMYEVGHALKNRVFDFSAPSVDCMLHGVTYSAPPTDELRVDSNDITVKEDSSLSTYYDSVKSFSIALGREFGLESSTLSHKPVSMPAKDMVSAFIDGAGTFSEFGLAVSSSVVNSKNLFTSVATLTKATYSMQTALSGDGKLCSEGIWRDLSALPKIYKTNTYQEFISYYGTHIVISASIGGYVQVNAAFCSSTTSSSATIGGYLSSMYSWTVDSSASTSEYETVTVSRSSSTVCGGDSASYFATPPEGSTPWDVWSPTVFGDSHDSCAINIELVPIYVLADSYAKRINLERAVKDYVALAAGSSGLSSDEYTCEPSDLSSSDSKGLSMKQIYIIIGSVGGSLLICAGCAFFFFG